jgi:cation transport ATPase
MQKDKHTYKYTQHTKTHINTQTKRQKHTNKKTKTHIQIHENKSTHKNTQNTTDKHTYATSQKDTHTQAHNNTHTINESIINSFFVSCVPLLITGFANVYVINQKLPCQVSCTCSVAKRSTETFNLYVINAVTVMTTLLYRAPWSFSVWTVLN